MTLRPLPVLKNIGPVSARWLGDVGVRKRSDLIRLGAVAAYLKVKDAGHKPSLNLLWALAGAERGLAWSKITTEQRERLLLELDAAQGASTGERLPSPVTPAAARKPQPVPLHRPGRVRPKTRRT